MIIEQRLPPRAGTIPRMKTLTCLLMIAALCACDTRWPDHAGVMGAPVSPAAPAQQAAQQPLPIAQGLTQSSR